VNLVSRTTLANAIQFLPRLTTAGMVVILVLQFTRLLAPGAGLLDVIILGVIGIVARVILRSRIQGSRKG